MAFCDTSRESSSEHTPKARKLVSQLVTDVAYCNKSPEVV